MKRLSTLAVALALALGATAAFADDNSMSRWHGESYHAFEAAASAGAGYVNSGSRALLAADDNSMSRWHGDSYKAFADALTGERTTLASFPRTKAEPVERPRVSRLSSTPVPPKPFRDDTAA
jgi:hypothetical protein